MFPAHQSARQYFFKRTFDSSAGAMNNQELIEKWQNRAVSWSQLSLWKRNKNQWFDSYILDKKFSPTAAMIFGSVVGDTLGTGKKKSMVPKLEKYLKGEKEHEIHVRLNNKMLIGYTDHYCPVKKILNENKTSQTANRWNQIEVDNSGQLTMYALMIMLRDGTPPDDLEIYLNVVPVFNRPFGGFHIPDPNNFYRYQTKRTVLQCLDFGSKIEQRIKQMEHFARHRLDLKA